MDRRVISARPIARRWTPGSAVTTREWCGRPGSVTGFGGAVTSAISRWSHPRPPARDLLRAADHVEEEQVGRVAHRQAGRRGPAAVL
ncbi:hypothetical protein ABZ816_17605 [Actinosynnema sp. NPDC047251]|uniref:hypothetical protein n=1 Tax=Saccharothrix espanaensis TaxID=103731 RepID=UPI000312B4B7|nr:hypothetical protein [Saccharothrix espanaensis]